MALGNIPAVSVLLYAAAFLCVGMVQYLTRRVHRDVARKGEVPSASWLHLWEATVRQHRDLYPNSRVVALRQLFTWIAIACWVASLASVVLRPR